MTGRAAGPRDDPPAWLHMHAHDSNPTPPAGGDTTLRLIRPNGTETAITLAALASLPSHVEAGYRIGSTGHPTSGPFDFGGVRLLDLILAYVGEATPWSYADVTGADGYGNRIQRAELETPRAGRAVLLATRIDGQAMTRQQGVVRLIVPQEQDEALRQVKWVARIDVH